VVGVQGVCSGSSAATTDTPAPPAPPLLPAVVLPPPPPLVTCGAGVVGLLQLAGRPGMAQQPLLAPPNGA
jgi:hypothetical protein